MINNEIIKQEAYFIVKAVLDRKDNPRNNSLPVPEKMYCNMARQIDGLFGNGQMEYLKKRIRAYAEDVMSKEDADTLMEHLRDSYAEERRKRKAVPRPNIGYLAGGDSDRKIVPTSVRLPTTAERGGSIDDFLRDPLTERATYVAQEMAKPNRDYTPELAYYNIAPTLNGQKENFDEIVRKEATRLGMNGAEVVEYLNKMNEFLKQTKDIIEAEKQRLADPQSKKKPDVMYTTAVCNANGHKVLFDMVLDLEARKHGVLGLVESLQAQYEELMAQSGKLGSDIVVSRTDIGEQERSTGQARRATGAVGYAEFTQQMTGADQAEGGRRGAPEARAPSLQR